MSAVEAKVSTYRRPYSGAWWLRSGRTVAYMAREFTAVPIALWWLWFLVEIARAKSGPGGYAPHMSLGFVVFSCVCLVFALWHSYTFLSLSGLILRLPFGTRWVPARLISSSAFLAFFVASAAIAALLVYFGHF
jgi:fumarate reductase subunit C